MTNYIKGEPLDTAEKFVMWASQNKPYYSDNSIRFLFDEANDYYEYGKNIFQALPAPEKKVKKTYAYENGNIITQSTKDYGKWLDLDDGSRAFRFPEWDIIYPESGLT